MNNTNPTITCKNGDELRCSGRVSYSCSTCTSIYKSRNKSIN